MYKLTDEIVCPNCGDIDNLRLSGEEVYENFFDGKIGEGCVCNACGQRFMVWFSACEIDWDEGEEDA